MGKALLIIVLGFSTIFGTVMFNITRSHQRSSQAIVLQYEKWLARNAMESVTNVALSKIYQNPGNPVSDSLAFGEAFVTISTQPVAVDSVLEATRNSITIIATYENERDTTAVIMMHPAYSYYYYFAHDWPSSDLVYSTGDTVSGVIHSNEEIQVSGSPVFLGRVSSADADGYNPNSETPQFYGGAEFGIGSLPLPNVGPLKAVIGATEFSTDVWLVFNAAGTYNYSISGPLGPWVTGIALSGPTIIKTVGSGNDIFVSGTVNGTVTVLSKENLYIDQNIVCHGPDDYLGLVAEKNIIVRYSSSATSNVQAALIANGVFQVENTNILLLFLTLNITGSLVVNQDQAFTSLINFAVVSRNHIYDDRLRDKTPPYFPRVLTGAGKARIETLYRNK